MDSIFDEYDKKAEIGVQQNTIQQIERQIKSSAVVKRGYLKILAEDQQFRRIKCVVLPDRLYLRDENCSAKDSRWLSIKWKRVFPFSESNTSGDKRYGFKVTGFNYCQEFYVEGASSLDDWMQTLGPYVVLMDVSEDYNLTQIIGSGNYATVYEARWFDDGKLYAVKSISKQLLSKVSSNVDALEREIQILRTCNHPNILKLYRVYEDTEYIHLVTDYATDGELFARIYKRKKFSEDVTKAFMKGMLETLDYLHNNGIVHRDLKPENVLMMSAVDDSKFTLADFGLAAYTLGPPLVLRCGSPGYVAPEIFKNEPYDSKVDVFSAGILMYIFLTGKAAFTGLDPHTILANNKKGEIQYHDKYWYGISPNALSLVKSLLQAEPINRPTASQALKHAWFKPQKTPRIGRSIKVSRSISLATTERIFSLTKKSSVNRTRFISTKPAIRSIFMKKLEQTQSGRCSPILASYDRFETIRQKVKGKSKKTKLLV